MFNEVIYLITKTEPTYDEDGFEKEASEIRTKAYAQVKTTTIREYDAGARDGERATDVFVVIDRDYNNAIVRETHKKTRPSFVEYDGVLYKIVRRFERPNGNYVVELSCIEVE